MTVAIATHDVLSFYQIAKMYKLLLPTFLAAILVGSHANGISYSNEIFGKQLFKRLLHETKGENIVTSPFGAHCLLTIMYAGAAGKTQQALKKLLNLGNPDAAASYYKEVLTELNRTESAVVRVANRIFSKKEVGVNPSFVEFLKNFFVEVQAMNFQYPDQTAGVINEWIRLSTRNKIHEIIEPNSIDPKMGLVLVNAFYFKGYWSTKFDAARTNTEKFYTRNGTIVNCKMMHVVGKFRSSSDQQLKATILELPYQGGQFSMLIFLPENQDGIDDLEKSIGNFSFSNYERRLRRTEENEVDTVLAFPRFKFETVVHLKELLIRMGLANPFGLAANFSKMFNVTHRLYLSEMVQKVTIEVNEDGTEAAAASFANFAMKSKHLTWALKVDHPFLFALVYKKNRRIYLLFMGRVDDPQVTETSKAARSWKGLLKSDQYPEYGEYNDEESTEKKPRSSEGGTLWYSLFGVVLEIVCLKLFE